MYSINIIIIRVFASFLLEEPLSAYCPAMSIFGNMAPVWTYSLSKVILPISFWTTPGHFWSHGHHSVTCLVHLLSFRHETCPAYLCLLVQIWWITSMTPVFEQIQHALFCHAVLVPSLFIHFTLCCDHFLQLCFAEGTCFTPKCDYWEYAFIVHFCLQPQRYCFVSHNGVQLAKSSPTKAYSTSQLLF